MLRILSLSPIMVSTRMTYDRDADAAYIYLVARTGTAEVARPQVADESVNLDFDAAGRLLGVEILGASGVLRAQVLREAEEIVPRD